MVTANETTVRFEGIGVGTEIWGGTQANFVIVSPGRHGKEAAVILNTPGAAYLAKELGEPETGDFRARAAEVVGHLWIERLLAAGKHIDSLIFLSREAMAESRDFVDALRADEAVALEPRHDVEPAHA